MLQAEYDAGHDAPVLTDALVQEYTARIAMASRAQADVKRLETEVAQATAAVNGAQARIRDIEEQIAEADAILSTCPSDDAYRAATACVETYRVLRESTIRLSSTVQVKKELLKNQQQAYDKAVAAEAKIASINEYRNILTTAREVLHRDNIPEAVLASYVGVLESACNMFLGMFGNPFAIMIDRGMDIRCVMPSGYTASARRLSAGQKCVLSVAMRFAINELFAKDFGLIILDEPTAFMDTDNIEYMRDLIAYIQTISQSTGIQTIIITHHRELISSFDNVIDI
jgi:DNA repair exonuclease SbcCD ATPase subunit